MIEDISGLSTKEQSGTFAEWWALRLQNRTMHFRAGEWHCFVWRGVVRWWQCEPESQQVLSSQFSHVAEDATEVAANLGISPDLSGVFGVADE